MKFKYILGIVLMIFLFTTMSAQNESGVFGYNSFELKGNFTYYNNYTINEFDFNESDLNVNSSDYWDEYDVVSDILFSDLTWNFGDDWNYISGDQFYFNDSKLSTKYYEPSSLEELEGTGIGTLSDIQTLEDGNIYTIEESNQAPGFDFRVNFTNINEFNQLYLRTSTNDNQDETISIQLYNYDTGSWNTQNSFTYLDDFQVFDIGIFNGQYIQDGTVQMRLYHSDKGKNNEEVYIDWISLAKGYGTPASEDLFYLQELLIDSTNINDTIKITDGNGNNISEVTINDNYEPDTNCSGDSSCSLITYDSETTGWDKDASDDLTTSTSFSGDISGTYNSLDIDSSVVSDREVSSLSWDELNNYPSACPEDTYLTQLGDSVTCTGIDDIWVDESGDSMSGNLNITKVAPEIRLYDDDTSNTTFGGIEFESNQNQGVKLTFNEYDALLPSDGYGLVLENSSTNDQFPSTGNLSLNVLGRIYAGGTSLDSLHEVYHKGNDDNLFKTTGGEITGNTSIDGSLGIKTTNPRDEIEINGNLRLSAPDSSSAVIRNIKIPDTGDSPDGIRFYNPAGGSNLLTIFDTGNIGIGVGEPDRALEINGQGSDTSILLQNYQFLGARNSSGSIGRLLGFDGSDKLVIGDIDDLGGSDLIRFDNAGTNGVMAINGTNIGMGLTNPDRKLQIKGGSGEPLSSNALFQVEDDGSNTIQMGVDDNNDVGWIRHANPGTSAGGKITLDGDGDIGINTENPNDKLHVNDRMQVGDPDYIAENLILEGRRTDLFDTSDNKAGLSAISGAGDFSAGDRGDLALHPRLDTGRGIRFFTNDGEDNIEERVRIGSDGNLGIGTTSPNQLLDIYAGNTGDAVIEVEADADNSGSEDDNPRLELYQDGRIVKGFVGIAGDSNEAFSGSQSNAMYLETAPDRTEPIQFATSNLSRMIITGNGDVGINDDSPSNKLTVNGNADFTGNVGIGTNSPDFKLDVAGNTYIEGDLEVGGELLDDFNSGTSHIFEEAFLFGYLSTTQTSVEGGEYVNVFENTDLTTSNIFSISDSELLVSTGGYYKFDYNVQVHRTGSGGRNIMESYLEVNGNAKQDRSATSCYIRTDGNGDECTMTGTSVLNLNGDDSVKLYIHEKRGGETGNDVEHARIKISRIR